MLFLVVFATISMANCVVGIAESPPKKDKDLSTNGVSVGNAPLENFFMAITCSTLNLVFITFLYGARRINYWIVSLPTSIRPSLFRKTPGIGLRFKLFLLPTH